MNLIDTHSHIHSSEFFSEEDAEAALQQAVKSGVTKIICVGTSLDDSKEAVAFANKHSQHCFAAIGIHPHEATKLTSRQITSQLKELDKLADDRVVVAIGECGFDFYYNDKDQALENQEQLLRGQIEISAKRQLPLSFHVREAFDEFWRVFESYKNIRGVLHSFTDRPKELARALSHNLVIGINGIATFTTHSWQKELFKQIDLGNFVLETDSPFLTPVPKRGTINTSENVIYITKYLADLRGENEELIANSTTATAEKLFNLE